MPLNQNSTQKRFFKKSLGQNILIDKNIIDKIIHNLNIKENDVLIEIGPGLGAITDELSLLPNKVIAIEKDTRFFDRLTRRYRGSPNIEILNADALKVDYAEIIGNIDKKIKVLGNLPYNISTQILIKLFEYKRLYKSFLFMFQKEVANRIIARPSTKAYGILSVLAQYHSHSEIVITVPATCFKPRPKVESAVVLFEIYEAPPFPVKDEKLFVAVVKRAFSKRRKTLLNCFKGFNFDETDEFDTEKIFQSVNINLSRRGETLSVEEFVNLTNSFSSYMEAEEC